MFIIIFKYTIGYETSELKKGSNIPDPSLVTHEIPTGNYAVFTAPSKEQVINALQQVWQSDLDRAFIADFEQYDLTTGEVNIYLGLKE